MRSYIFAAVGLVGVLQATPALAQVRAYHHHSTPYGDAMAGEAERILAMGIYARNVAEAERQLAELRYQWLESQREAQLARIEQRERRREAARDRQDRRRAASVAAARGAAESFRSQSWEWPAALQRPEYAAAVGEIEGLLKAWPASGEQVDAKDRQKLASLAKHVRQLVAVDRERLSYADRLRAVEALKRLQVLADVTNDRGPVLASR